MRLAIVVFFTAFSFVETALSATNQGQFLSVAQGVSSPNPWTAVNFSHGFTDTNPAVAPLSGATFLTGEVANSPGNTSLGAEFGLSNQKAGMNLGYSQANCSGCSGNFGVLAGLAFSSFSVGIGYHEGSTYSLGVLMNPKGPNRFGLTLDNFMSASSNNLNKIGIGYSYVGSEFIFALDASKTIAQNKTTYDDAIMITPGLSVEVGSFALTVSMDNYLQDSMKAYTNQLWFGVGYQSSSFHFAIYSDYVSDLSASLSFIF